MLDVKIKVIPYTLEFKRPAGTSRGVYHTHKVWYVLMQSKTDSKKWGIGEAAPLHDLSADYNEDYEDNLKFFCKQLEEKGELDIEDLRPYPSILFGLETAIKHYEANSFIHHQTKFSEGEIGIPINGLVWMGDYEFMREQIEEKLKTGFRCIKLKIGAINFEDELKLLQRIRKEYSADKIEIRVDANGAFSVEDAMGKLKALADLNLHSIEQPIKAGQWEEMAELCSNTPLDIALDEELIGVSDVIEKKALLKTIKPQYIILKPTLHGGFSGTKEWIEIAESLNVKWWITSALESNIGLNAIAQWCATLNDSMPQGLGTGGLYTNNIEMPLEIRKDCLWFAKDGKLPELSDFIK